MAPDFLSPRLDGGEERNCLFSAGNRTPIFRSSTLQRGRGTADPSDSLLKQGPSETFTGSLNLKEN